MRKLRWVSALVLFGVLSSGCITQTARSYTGAGSQWSLTLNTDSTFSLTKAASLGGAVDLTINGTYLKFVITGFTRLTVTDATGTGAPDVDDVTYLLELPGAYAFLQPFSEGHLIPLLPAGPSASCPSSSLTKNVVTMKAATGWTSAAMASGTLTYDPSTLDLDLTARYSLSAPSTSLGAFSLGTGTCSTGTFASTAGDATAEGEVFVTSTGAVAVHSVAASTTTDSIWMGYSVPSFATNYLNLAGNYSGMVYAAGAATGYKNYPISAVFTTTSSTITSPVYEVTSPTSGSVTTTGFQLTLNTAGQANGVLLGQIDLNGPTGGGFGSSLRTVVCVVDENAGTGIQDTLTCAADDTTSAFFSFVLVKR